MSSVDRGDMATEKMLPIMSLLFILFLLEGCESTIGPAQRLISTGDTSTSVRIGWIGPLTGGAAQYGVPELNAAKLAVEDLNAKGGIKGHPLELVVEDGKCDGATTTTAATKLIEVDQVNYISGGHCSTESMTIAPISDPKKVLIIAGATAAAKFSGISKYAFRTYPSAIDMYSRLAKFAYGKGTRTVVTFNEQKDGPQSIIDTFAQVFTESGGTVLGKEVFAPGSTDFRTQLLKIRELNPDAMMISVQSPDAASLIIKQMNELSINIQIYSDALVVTKSTYEKSGGLLPATAIGATGHINPEKSPETKQFLELYQNRYGEFSVDPFFATEGYDQVKILAGLIESCWNDTDCARNTLINTPWNGISGVYHFNDKGDSNPFFGIVRIEGGKVLYEFES